MEEEEIIEPPKRPNKQKRHLYLVQDNAPDYHERPSAKARLAEKEVEKKQENNDPDRSGVRKIPYVDQLVRRPPWYRISMISVLALVAAGIIGFSIYRTEGTPASKNNSPEIIPLGRDLNQDNIPDAYLQIKNGYKIPLYGVEGGNEIGPGLNYVTAEEMRRRFPHSTTDYQSIEDILNRP